LRRRITPARTGDDFPLPDAPTTTINFSRASFDIKRRMSASRPKKNATIRRILEHLRLPTDPLPIAPAREPPQPALFS
jgi:hypothetical protein